MNAPLLTCEQFQMLLEHDPYRWTPDIQSHRTSCASCRIAHVLLLAEADVPAERSHHSKPDQYFEELSQRILQQLPASSPRVLPSLTRSEWKTWLAPVAALLLLTLGMRVGTPTDQPAGSAPSALAALSPATLTEPEDRFLSDPFSPDWIPSEAHLTYSDDVSTFHQYFDSKEVDALLADLDTIDFKDSDFS